MNPRVIFDSFETVATSTDAIRAVIGDWTRSPQVRLAGEPLQGGGHSLVVNLN